VPVGIAQQQQQERGELRQRVITIAAEKGILCCIFYEEPRARKHASLILSIHLCRRRHSAHTQRETHRRGRENKNAAASPF